MQNSITELLTRSLREALDKAGLPASDDIAWEVPREESHGDYATNSALALARAAKKAPRQIAEAIKANFPPTLMVMKVEVAGPGFLNVFLSPHWCADALRGILADGPAYGTSQAGQGKRMLLEFVSANPTGPLVIVNARAAAVGDALARILRAQGHGVESQFYVNAAGNQLQALARSVDVRLRQAVGEAAELAAWPEDGRIERLGRMAVTAIVDGQRAVLEAYGTRFDTWAHEQADVRARGWPERAITELEAAGHTYEQDGALWFRSTTFGDDKDRVLRKSDGELTYFAVDIAFHHYGKFGRADGVINFLGPDHHGHIQRMKAAMEALGHPRERFDALIVQHV